MKTLEIAEAVRASVVLFQCPASFRAIRPNIENLSCFFQKIGPQSFRQRGGQAGSDVADWLQTEAEISEKTEN